MARKHVPTRFPVQVKVDGITYSGQYYSEGGMVTLETEFGPVSTQTGGVMPITVAKMLLRETVPTLRREYSLK